MGFKIFSIVFASLLIAGFSAIDYAYAQQLDTTPENGTIVFQDHAVIIDIHDAPNENPIPITIQVSNSAGDDPESWRGYVCHGSTARSLRRRQVNSQTATANFADSWPRLTCFDSRTASATGQNGFRRFVNCSTGLSCQPCRTPTPGDEDHRFKKRSSP